jgi:protein-histidine pros-kinase
MAGLVLRDGVWAGLVEHRRKNGSRFTARLVKTRRRGASDEADGFLMISSDVTDEVRLSGELDRAREFSEALVESAPDAMVIVRDDGAIQFVNSALEQLFGYDRTELVEKPVEILMPARHRSVHPGHRGGFFKQPQARSMGAGLNLTALRKDGVEVPVEISLSPLVTDERTLVTAAIRDVSERTRNEHELREANVRLESASQAKDRFLANMSHELRTPLNAILGFTGTMLMELPGPLNELQRKQLRTVQSSGRHLLSLINDLLDLARIESGKVELNIETIVGGELLEEIASTLRPLADAKGIGLEIVADAELTVSSDRRALRQILINLANNAIKFTDEGRVLLKLSRHEGPGVAQAHFSVIDSGCGIGAEDQAKLFDAFEQVAGSGERPYEGTGLGLYICRTLAGVLDAAISFESEVGRGSTFTLELAD